MFKIIIPKKTIIFFFIFSPLSADTSSSVYNMHFNVNGMPQHSIKNPEDHLNILKYYLTTIKVFLENQKNPIKHLFYNFIFLFLFRHGYVYLSTMYEKKIKNYESVLLNPKSFTLFCLLMPEYIKNCLSEDAIFLILIENVFFKKDISALKECLFLIEQELEAIKSLKESLFIYKMLFINRSFFIDSIIDQSDKIFFMLEKIKKKIAYILKSDYYYSQY